MAIEAQWMQNGSYSGREDRQLLAAIWDEGVLGTVGLKVSPPSGGDDPMSVNVAVGKAVVAGDDQPNQGSYLVTVDALVNVPLSAAPGSNSRYDRIVLQVRDPDAGGPAGDDAIATVVTGIAASTPTVPAVPASAISLAVIGPIGVGKTSIITGDIADDRPWAGQRDTPGVLKPYTGPANRIPTGWLLGNGAEVSRALYPDLAALYEDMGWPFGDGNGSTTFNLPDFRDRFPAPIGTFHTDQGDTGGAQVFQLTEFELPAHTHPMTHTHTTPNHQHPIDHDHAQFNSNSSGAHVHDVLTVDLARKIAYSTNTNLATGAGNPGLIVTVAATGGTNIFEAASAGSHVHSVNPPAFAGNTSSSGGGTTGASTASVTGSRGDGVEMPILDPYLVVTGYLVRT